CRVHTRIRVDRDAPQLVAAAPAGGAAGVGLGDNLTLDFSEEVKLNGGLQVSAAGSTTLAGTRVAYVPRGGWPSDATVTVTLTSAVTDLVGNALANPSTWSFHTVDKTGPGVPTLDPLPDVTNASTISVCGSAEKGSSVRIEGGTSPVEKQA